MTNYGFHSFICGGVGWGCVGAQIRLAFRSSNQLSDCIWLRYSAMSAVIGPLSVALNRPIIVCWYGPIGRLHFRAKQESPCAIDHQFIVRSGPQETYFCVRFVKFL